MYIDRTRLSGKATNIYYMIHKVLRHVRKEEKLDCRTFTPRHVAVLDALFIYKGSHRHHKNYLPIQVGQLKEWLMKTGRITGDHWQYKLILSELQKNGLIGSIDGQRMDQHRRIEITNKGSLLLKRINFTASRFLEAEYRLMAEYNATPKKKP